MRSPVALGILAASLLALLVHSLLTGDTSRDATTLANRSADVEIAADRADLSAARAATGVRREDLTAESESSIVSSAGAVSATDFRLRVFDEVTREPLANALVAQEDLEHGVSDADGVVVLPLAANDNSGRLEVRLAGYAPASLFPEALVGGATIEVPMREGAVLRGSILGMDPDEDLVVHASARRGYLRVPRGVHRSKGRHRKWNARVDAGGHFELRDLPSDAPIFLRASSDERDSESLQADWLVLAPGSVTEMVWDWTPSCALTVLVVDASGRPVPACPVTMRSSAYNGSQRLVTDDAGRIVLTERRPGRLRFETSTQWRSGENWAVEPGSVELLPGDHLELTLIAREAAFLSGRILDRSGAPYAPETTTSGPFVYAWPRDEQSATHEPRTVICERDGTFRIGPLLPGEYLVQAFGGPSDAGLDPEAVAVRAPASSIDLRYRPSGVLTVRIVDGETGGGRPGVLVLDGHHVAPEVVEDAQPPGSSYVLRNVEPGEHAVLAVARDGRVGVRSGIAVRMGESVHVDVHVQQGSELVVRVPTGASEYVRVQCGAIELVRGEELHSGRRRFHVPPGPVVVEHVDRVPWIDPAAVRVLATRRAEVGAGERVEVGFE